jgi:hypothetical protein
MRAFPELEIGLRPHERDVFALTLRFQHPESAAELRLASAEALVRIDRAALQSVALQPEQYGAMLSTALFADPATRTAFAQARSAAAALQTALRVRLVVEAGPDAPDDLRWELLRDPERDVPLTTDEQILFSRFLAGDDWRPVRLAPRPALRALVVIANPSDLGDYAPGGRQLAPIDVAAELARARTALGDIPIMALAEPGQPTLERMLATLRDGYDMLYLVAHGALAAGAPRLWLEDDQGLSAIVAGEALVTRLRELRRTPLLVVLASCQSAGGPEPASMDQGALAALGPRLAAAGVPAVVAMQGNITQATLARFLPVLITEVRRDGQIDRAVAVARGAVRDRADWWAPVLFLRLRDGRLWASGEAPVALSWATWRVWLRQQATLGRVSSALVALVVLIGAIFSIGVGSGLIPEPGVLPTPVVPPPVMDGDLNVAVARFGSTTGPAGGVNVAPESDRLGEEFAGALAADLDLERLAVQYLPASKWYSGTLPIARPEEAEALARAVNADIVVYGALAYDRQSRITSFAPQFYLAPRKLSVAAGPQLVGHHSFGAPITVPGEPVNGQTMGRLREALALRTTALADVLIGFDAYVLDDYAGAEAAFARADGEGALGDESGRAVVYLFRATAAGRRTDPAALDDAERYYREMLAISERADDPANRARAQLGLAAVTFFAGAQGECVLPAANATLIEQAIALYADAAQSTLLSAAPTDDIAVWSRFGQGRGHFCLAIVFSDDALRSGEHLFQAERQLTEAIGVYQAGDELARERLRYFAGEAYGVLGSIRIRRATTAEPEAATAAWAQAVDEYNRAIAASPHPARQAVYYLQLAFIALQQRDCARADAAMSSADVVSRLLEAESRDLVLYNQRRAAIEAARAVECADE